MKRGIITITGDGLVDIPDVPVWMTLQEIADLFGIFCLDIRRKMRTVYKEGVLTEKETKQEVKVDVRTSLEVYSLEFVVSISFRVGSGRSRIFRKYMVGLMERNNIVTCLFIQQRPEKTCKDN